MLANKMIVICFDTLRRRQENLKMLEALPAGMSLLYLGSSGVLHRGLSIMIAPGLSYVAA